jgi:predicted nucleotidyltransferase
MKDRLRAAFGDRLRGLVLYGSQARGHAPVGSDLDLLVLLCPPVELGRDLDRVVHAIYDLQLAVDGPIHALPVDADVFEAGDYALYRSAKREGVRL